MDIEFLEARSQIIQKTRDFFKARGFLEVETPLLSPDLIPETSIEVFKTELLEAKSAPPKPLYLVPSPEIYMKKLIARHSRNIFQISKCFRNCEYSTPIHNFEFTMLEFYTINADYLESLSITEALFDSLCGTQVFQIPFKRVTMEDAFKLHAGFSLLEAIKKERLQFHAKALGLETRSGASAEELFNLIFIHSVEPKLRNERSLALIDYPAAVPCLAAPNPDGLTLQRWELYVKGIEMANCYSEETRAEAVKAYFEVQSEQKRLSARIPHNVDSDYWKIFQRSDSKTNLAYSGVAIGFDRLIMAICGLKNIDAILP